MKPAIIGLVIALAGLALLGGLTPSAPPALTVLGAGFVIAGCVILAAQAFKPSTPPPIDPDTSAKIRAGVEAARRKHHKG